MNKESDFSTGLSHEFVISVVKAGWSPQQMDSLAKDLPLLKKILGVLMKTHVIIEREHKINCDEEPVINFPLVGLYENRKDGILIYNPEKLKIYISKGQKGRKQMYLEDILKDFRKEPFHGFNAKVLEYLLENPGLIPEEFKRRDRFDRRRYFLFPETEFKNFDGVALIKTLFWKENKWETDSVGYISSCSSNYLIPYFS